MTTLLVNDGWRNADGKFFPWTNQADVVDEGDEILVDVGVVANTLGGGDIITGTGDFVGIANRNNSMIETGNGNDIIEGTSTNPIGAGIVNNGINSMIETGNGNDIIIGINTDRRGIINEGTINTGKGNDDITGTGDLVGISNSGMIETRNGKDTVDALTGGFDGGGTINLGRGKDLIQGFGEQSVFGGQGMDTAKLGIDFDTVQISPGDTATSINITSISDSTTMAFTDVEKFDFNGDVFTLEDLQGEVV